MYNIKKILFSILIVLVLFTVNFSAFILKDYLEGSSLTKYSEKIELKYSHGENSIEYYFSTKENYLGIIDINIPFEKVRDRIINVAISDTDGNNIFLSDITPIISYSSEIFNLGIPLQEMSSGNKYKVLISSNKKVIIKNVNDFNYIHVHHVFPSGQLINNPKYVYLIIKQQLSNYLHNVNFISLNIIVLVLILSIVNKLRIEFALSATYLPLSLLYGALIDARLASILIGHWVVIMMFIFFITNFEKEISKLVTMNINKRIVLFITVVILAISSLSGNFYLGGDETRLYYVYPEKYLMNYVSNLVVNTTPSNISYYIPVNSLENFVRIIYLLKNSGIENTQNFLFVGNILLGMFSFYSVMKEFISGKYSKFISLLSSVLYVFSIFNGYSIYISQNYSQYLLSIVPMTLFLFIRYLKSENIKFIYAILLITVIFPIFPMVPTAMAFVISLIPLFIHLFIEYRKKFIKGMILIVFFGVILNLNWLGHLIVGYLSNNNSSAIISQFSDEGGADQRNGVVSTSKLLNSFDIFINLYPKKIQQNFQWPQLAVYDSWYSKLKVVNVIFLLVYCISVFKLKKFSSRQFGIFIIMNFILSVYLFGGNFFGFGREFFAQIITSIPGMIMFRNMFDKFALPLSFSISLLMAYSINNIVNLLKNERSINVVLIIFVVVVSLNSKPVILNEMVNLPVWTTTNTHASINRLNQDYLSLVDMVENLDGNSRVITLPLNLGNSSIIRDDLDHNKTFIGVSPMLIMSGRNDFSGFLSFGEYAHLIKKYYEEGELNKIGVLFKKLGIGYIVIDTSLSNEILSSYLFSYNYIDWTNSLKSLLLGDKIADFGNSYSLYRIKDEFRGEVFVEKEESVFLSEKFDTGWSLILDGTRYPGSKDELFGIQWKRPGSDNYKIEFTPLKYSGLFNTVSLVSLIILIFMFIRKNEKS